MIKTLENHDFVVCINGLAFWHSSGILGAKAPLATGIE
jgi:hypothetical protein